MKHLCACFTLASCSHALADALPQEAPDSALCDTPDSQAPAQTALLQVAKSASLDMQLSQIRTQACATLVGTSFKSGAEAALDENGYRETAQLNCHHEMSFFVRREAMRQGFDICDLSDLHGFVHWYDNTNDAKTYAEMADEISRVATSHCPWLGRLGQPCPPKGPNCGDFPPCPAVFPPNSQPGAFALLNEEGYAAVARRCCRFEMEQFLRREIDRQGFFVCDEGGFLGLLHWYDCENDYQNYAHMVEEVNFGATKAPCLWLGPKGGACPPRAPNCPRVEEPEPTAHRRRTSCR